MGFPKYFKLLKNYPNTPKKLEYVLNILQIKNQVVNT